MDMEIREELRASLQEFLEGANVEIRENGNRITAVKPLSWEIRGESNKPLLHLWGENCNVTRRVLAIADHSDSRLALAVERFGRAKPERLEIVRLGFVRSGKELSREEFCEQLRRILAEQFPDETLEKISIAADLEHSLSGMYARGISRRGPATVAFLAVPSTESPDAIESSLTFALLWFHRAKQTTLGAKLSALRLIVPKGKSSGLAHRLAALGSNLPVVVYELDPTSEKLDKVDPCATGNVATWLVPHRESQGLLDRAHADLAPIIRLAPEAITSHASVQTKEVVLRFRGLAFVRWRDNRVFCTVSGLWKELDARTELPLKQLILNLQAFRSPQATDTRHRLFRGQSERWLQSVIAQNLARVDINLDPDHVYEQVSAQAAGQHGILDLLAVTRAGRLAILELKAAEDVDLPLQAGDYWSRIRRHQQAGDLARYGYFHGITLQQAAPLVYLISPVLRFHPSTDAVLRYLTPEMEIIRIGLAEGWRRDLRVMIRQ
jgi:hypothetical protein